MDMIKQYLKNPLIAGVLGLVLGILIGWFVIGWGVWPVEFINGELSDLRVDLQDNSMRQAIDAYAMNKDADLAIDTYNNFGEDGEVVLARVKESGMVNAANLALFEMALGAQGIPVSEAAPEEMPVEAEVEAQPEVEAEAPVVTEVEKDDAKSNLSTIGILLGVLLAIFLVGLAVFAYFFFIKGNQGRTAGNKRSAQPAPSQQQAQSTPTGAGDMFEEAPAARVRDTSIKQFITEYVYGNDLYDDTFSIDAASGEFLGECGVGILDTVGSTETKSVTAFEVWLFDKNDVQTVTKVLMTDFAMNNLDIRHRVEVKGEPVQIVPDLAIYLETATLQLEGHVLNIEYGPGAGQGGSVVQRLQIEMTINSKEALA